MTGHDAGGPLGLYTDLYELRMAESYLRRGMTDPATFSLYVRPDRRRPWFVALGAHRVLELLARFSFGVSELDHLRRIGFPDDTIASLRSLVVDTGEVWAVPDGTVLLAEEPILELTAPLPVAQLLETAVINLVHYPTLVATKAARVALAAAGRAVVDFGFRRAHGLATGIEAALAARVGGVEQTSNVEAGRRFGIPVVGTMAHAFVQAFDDELDAFRAYADDHPDGTVLLVDTYDTLRGVRNAIIVADELRARGTALRGIRLDSGDLGAVSREARRLLDDAGHGDVSIFASGGLEEEGIARLVEAEAPIDAFGVGTDLVVSRDRPAIDIAYKLVEYRGRGRRKRSEGKATLPGAKQVFRDGSPASDVLALRGEQLPGRPLLEPVWRDGRPLRTFDADEARERARGDLEALPERWRRIPSPPDTPVPARSDRLNALAGGNTG